MPYTTTVESCSMKTVGEATQFCATLVTKNDAGTEVLRRVVGIDAATFPTTAEAKAELKRIATADIAALTNADTVCSELEGVVL